MRSFFKICAIALMLLMINVSLIPTLSTNAAAESKKQDPGELNILQKTYFFMRKGKLLHPESPDKETAPKAISCPPKTEPMYPRLPGKWIRKYVWVDLPFNFKTNPVNNPIKLGHNVLFKLWFRASEENLGSIQFKFILYAGDSAIAQTDTVDYRRTLEVDQEAQVSATAGINITDNQLNSGEQLEVHIRYWVNGDGLEILYDNPLVDSGIELESNSIKIREISGNKASINAYYRESFNVKAPKMNFICLVDETPVETEPSLGSSNSGRSASWGVNLKPGKYTVTVMISYGGNANESMAALTQEINVVIYEPARFLGLTMGTWGKIIILVILLAIAVSSYKIYRSRQDEAELMKMLDSRVEP